MPSASVKAKAYQVVERQRLVRRLLVEGLPDGEIVKILTLGVDLPPPIGRVSVSEATARRDIVDVAAEFAALCSDRDASAIEIGTAKARIRSIAVKAASGPRPQYHAALQANRALIELAARSHPDFHHLATGRVQGSEALGDGDGDGEDTGLVAELAELKGLDRPELERRHRQLEARTRALGLTVHPGTGTTGKG
jgi:hypothetical protein